MKVVFRQPNTTDGRVISSLSLGKAYDVIGIEADDYRIVDDKGEPLLFDPTCFDLTDRSEPSFWVSVIEDDAQYAYPAEWMRPGFFEDYFDYNEAVREEFWSQYHRYYAP